MSSLILPLLLLAAPLIRASPHPASHERRSEAGATASQYGRRVAIPGLEQRGYSAFMRAAEPFEESSLDEETDHVIPLASIEGTSPSKKVIDMLINRDSSLQEMAKMAKMAFPDQKSGEVPIQNVGDAVYLTTVNFGGETFTAVLDTGSADTWLVGEGFRCSRLGAMTPAQCKFGNAYKKSKSFVEVTQQLFSTKYADGETLAGIIGRETVTLGGITVKNQTVAIVNNANWHGDGKSSGLIGMAFPSVTRAHDNSNPMARKIVKYNPIFFTMYKAGLIKPTFSLTLNRVEEGPGVLALGGLPKSIKHENRWARAPMEYLSIMPSVGGVAKEYTLYAVKAGGFTVNGTKVASSPNVVIDSGTTLSYLPAAVVTALAKGFNPPARSGGTLSLAGSAVQPGMMTIGCNATPPKFAIVINGTSLSIDARELIHVVARNTATMAPVLCTLSVAPSGGAGAGGLSILGGPFLRSVLAVFDVGAAEMRFANRIR